MECMFSGSEADTEEHVIPKWLQNRFNLWNQKLTIPNNTTLPYRQVKVPVLLEHNNAFSVIEKNIERGIFNKNEVYLWALKIHIGLIYRDASLKIDRKIKESPAILNVNDFTTEVFLFRALYKNWRNGGRTTPSPFGGVFIQDTLMNHSHFDLFHCIVTGTVGVNLGSKFIVVFLWDQNDSENSSILKQWDDWHANLPGYIGGPNKDDYGYMAHHAWACESAYWLYRNRRNFSFIQTNNELVLAPPMFRPDGRAIKRTEYTQVCRNFGLLLEKYNGEVENVYSSVFSKQ